MELGSAPALQVDSSSSLSKVSSPRVVCELDPTADQSAVNAKPEKSTKSAAPTLPSIDALRELPVSALPEISAQLRQTLIQSVSTSGGHFASGLGVVELTVALHYVFKTPSDRVVWDVGHQCYPHKILTDRASRITSIRQQGGLSGFPVREESPFDAFGVAHAGTSISAALGMAMAQERTGTDRRVVAVIGDGALTEGMAFEALNHAGFVKGNLLIILNENAMSISPNVGALAQTAQPELRYKRFFEALGADYHGPVDGHDVASLVAKLQELRQTCGLQVLHTVTTKGKGYAPAEQSPTAYHAVPSFNPDSGVKKSQQASSPTYTQVFGQWICDSAAADESVVAITPAMREGSGLVAFEQQHPGRYFDVGIAEQHAVTFAAGLACEQLKPVVAVYSSFLQRAYDQVVHDVALQNLDVLFAIDRAGLVGADGATHHGSFDLSYLRCIPNLVLMAPANENECRLMLQTGLQHPGPAAVRYERGQGPGVAVKAELDTLPIGKAEILRHGSRIAILSFGSMLDAADKVAEQLSATLVNMRFIKPLDEALLNELSGQHEIIVTLENNAVAGGAGSAVNECLLAQGNTVQTLNLGLPDRFVNHGTQNELLTTLGLDVNGIIESIQHATQEQVPVSTL